MQTPQVTVGVVTAERAPGRRRDLWYGPFIWPSWVVDWIGHAGHDCVVSVGGTDIATFVRPPRTWMIIPPGVAYRHRDRTPPAQEEHLWFYFELAQPWALLAGRRFHLAADPEERLAAHVHAMRTLTHHAEPGHALAVLGHALTVFGEVALASQRGGDGSPEHPWRIRASGGIRDSLLQRLEHETLRDLAHPPSLAQLAERMGMSVSSLCHRFKSETGMGVQQRVRWLRLREARRLLAQPGATVKETARRLGFSSPFHLSTAFRQVIGMTAADYMRQHQREA